MNCILCNTRKARRRCPAAEGDICPQCCAEYREEKFDCPLDCEYLLEARRHEKFVPLAPADMPHPEVRLTDEFLSRNDMLVQFTMACVAMAALETPGVTDADLREAIDSLIQTLKTADSGLIYETKPVNPYAATVHEKIKVELDRLRGQIAEQSGGAALRDKDILGVLVFLSRVSSSMNNGRRKGRAFLSMLREKLPLKKPEPAPASALLTS